MWGCELNLSISHCLRFAFCSASVLYFIWWCSQSTLVHSKPGHLHDSLYSRLSKISHQGLPRFQFLLSLCTGHTARLQIISWNVLHSLVKPAKPVRPMAWEGFLEIIGQDRHPGECGDSWLNRPECVSTSLCVATWLAGSALPPSGTCVLQ